jgi:hypothetical protein
METGKGLDNWLGRTDERLEDAEDQLDKLWEKVAESEERHQRTGERLVSVETKLIFFAAIAAAVGGMIPSALAALLK